MVGTCNDPDCWKALNRRLFERDQMIRFQDIEIRQLKESIHSLQVIPRDAQSIIDGLALSVRSHRTYRENLESGIRKILSQKEADRLIEEAHI